MRIALISDIHANLPALEAVLAAIAAERVDLTLCLGDLVGYNADPHECLALLQTQVQYIVAGNHDYDIARESSAPGTVKAAHIAQTWTRQTLNAAELAYLDGLPNKHIENGTYIAVHGCYLNDWHVTGYVTSTMLEKNLAAIAQRETWPKLAFCGHTHVPLAGYLDGEETVESNPIKQPIFTWPKNARAVLLNPGSVGQPRDNSTSAAFALLDLTARRAEFRRAPYDLERTIASIHRAGLPGELAERLREGR